MGTGVRAERSKPGIERPPGVSSIKRQRHPHLRPAIAVSRPWQAANHSARRCRRRSGGGNGAGHASGGDREGERKRIAADVWPTPRCLRFPENHGGHVDSGVLRTRRHGGRRRAMVESLLAGPVDRPAHIRSRAVQRSTSRGQIAPSCLHTVRSGCTQMHRHALPTTVVKVVPHQLLRDHRIAMRSGYTLEWDMTALPAPTDGFPVLVRRVGDSDKQDS
jgi:hypothetical protein